MITNKIFGTRFVAVAIFFGLNAHGLNAHAYQTENLYVNGKPVIELNFFNRGEFSSEINFNAKLVDASKLGADYWKNLLRLRTVTPWQIAFVTSSQRTVDGKSFSFDAAEFTSENYLAQMLKGDRDLALFDMETLSYTGISADEVQSVLEENSPSEDSALSYVTIGRNLGAKRSDAVNGWFVDADTVLPANEQAADFIGALRLELARSIGVQVLLDGSKFADILDENAWTLHLADSNGNFASAGKEIVTSDQLGSRDAADFFVADKTIYFVGDNVSEVLNGATFDEVSGIPINAWDGSTFDGVHTLIPGLMTALPYKNYSTFTELELAALQDIGYDINRSKFYGLSIYNNGKTVNNTKSFSSSEDLAIGLHVFGSKNTVNQSGKISLTGTGAVGIRVDGESNDLTVPAGTNISSSGERGKGLLVAYGREHNLTVGGNISASGDGGNAVEFNFGSNALGAGGEYRGSYLRYLRYVDASGNIISAKNLPLTIDDGFNYSADELNGALVNDFNLSGKLYGANNAIYIGKNAFVKNINVNAGASIVGDITSDWKHFTTDDGFLSLIPVEIQYKGKSYDVSKYIPDLATNLNFNADLSYDGNINGADNIKMHVNGGTLNYSGTADILSVEVARGAKLFGGTFTLNDMKFDIADGFTDATTGTFTNHGTIGALDPNSNLIINGNLISDGTLQKISGGRGGKIIVNGTANIDGSTVTTDSLLPNQTETVLIADTVTGNVANPVGSPVKLSALLRATGAVVGNTVTVTTYEETTSLPQLDSQENQTLDAMDNMYETLSVDGQQGEMTSFFYLDEPETVQTLQEIGSNDSAKIMSVAQQNNAVDHMISDRISRVFAPDFMDMPRDFMDMSHAPDFGRDNSDIAREMSFNPNDSMPEYVDVIIRPNKLADGDSDAPEVKVKVKVPRKPRENNFWLNYMKNWGSLNGGGTDYHGSVIVGGYDRPFGKHVRAGLFATYGTIGYGARSSRATVYDTRIGLYAGYHNKQSDVYFYVNGGQLRNSLHRGISALGLSTNAKYKSHIVEIGGEYKYDLTPKKIWHISPFVNFQASHLKQNGYQEHGAGIYNQHVESGSNTYFAGQIGLDFKRYYKRGMIGFRFGVKHGFTGADPDLTVRYEGDSSNSYRLRNSRDKTHFVFSLRGENEFARGWSIGGETEFQISKNDRDVTASIMLRRIW